MTRLLAAALAALLPAQGSAQDLAQIVADEVDIVAERDTLVARGNVEAFHEGTRLTAETITYDRAAGRLTIAGPILITTPEGEVFTAETAEIDPDLEAGLLRGARLILDRQLQLAARRVDRTGTGLTALTQTAATSCRVCGDGPPLWEIRAGRVVHDEAARQLHFEDATFRLRGLPILWLPYMRLPDPTLKRAAGLLVPQILSSDQLGIGLSLPYFIPLGPSRDLTVTPFLSTRARTLGLDYRQAFRRGWVGVDATLSRDDDTGGDLRYGLFAEGAFALPRDVMLDFDLEAVSDPAYLLDYDISDRDRLDSRLRLYRLRDDGYFLGRLTYYESLREGEDSDSLPPLVGRAERQRIIRDLPMGGRLRLEADADALVRQEGATGLPPRDVARAGLGADWLASTVAGPGLLLEGQARVDLDAYAIHDDPDYDATALRARQAGALRLRWPLMRHEAGGATQLLEPVASLAYAGVQGDDVPNEDALLVEFDEANLLALDRLPGEDREVEGWHGALGLGWSRIVPEGWSATLTAGRVLRRDPAPAAGAELGGTASDWLLAGGVQLEEGLRVGGRVSFDDGLGLSAAEARLGWDAAWIDLSGAYVRIEPDAEENRPERVSEISFEADVAIGQRWSLNGGARYDIASDSPLRAEIGVGWRNECVTVDLSAARRYTETEDADASTSFGLSVNLAGFSAGRPARPVTRSCDG
ncbi:LPS-assembly protein LptD [Limimaricola pyoseonensis]|uniref:LPS-assembly protein LptD n=1 Tax=Limimaricola pyoseonensis TaxID=521013 RepID=A0A1G7APY5_9RHOB|nr:LPS assembly protein LptD [Limimaricola pyoseonensis]SDE16871.1 LPS-assembly protein [Limimaricola pyoseonensis]